MLKVLSQYHITIVTCVNFIAGTLKMVVKYSPKGMHIHVCMSGILYFYIKESDTISIKSY